MTHRPTLQPKINEDYKLIPHPESESELLVEFMDGPYTGVTYQFLTVRFIESRDGETMNVKYTGEIVSNPSDLPVMSDFDVFTAEVLHDILTREMSSDNLTYKEGHGFSVRDLDPSPPPTET